MAHMIAARAAQCTYGCCRSTAPSGRRRERRWLKRGERQQWKAEVRRG